MPAKDVRNLILGLIILAAGVFFITRIAKGFIGSQTVPGLSTELTGSLDSISTLFLMGVGVIVIILIPVYLSKRSGDKKAKMQAPSPPVK